MDKKEPLLKELQKITKILTLAHANSLEKSISKYATTDTRKKIWVLIDGVNMPKDMVTKIGKVKVRAIERFLDVLENAGLIENPRRKPPSKLIDFVPSSWIELLGIEEAVKSVKEKPQEESEG